MPYRKSFFHTDKTALCEAACTCNLNGKPVTTKANELSIIENAYESGYLAPNPPKTRTGKRVAVVGSGPSGLSAAYWLNKRGHEVTVYERSDRPGGLLMYGIPNMKLEKRFVKRRVELMKAEGIHFLTGVNVGKDISAEDLKSQYDSVILACGASNPRDIQAEGRDAEGIYFAEIICHARQRVYLILILQMEIISLQRISMSLSSAAAAASSLTV